MCSKSLNSSLSMVYRSFHCLHPYFSPFLGYNEILHFSKSPCTLLLWHSNSFGFGELPSVCLVNSYSAFGASTICCPGPFPPCHFTFQIPALTPPPQPIGFPVHLEHPARRILIPSIPVYSIPPSDRTLGGQGPSLLGCCCIFSTSTVPGPVVSARPGLFDTVFHNDFLDVTPKAQVTKAKLNEYDYIKQQPPGAPTGEPGETQL